MANVLDIRRRIKSVKNTQQITRAMKFVAAARLRKAQDRMMAARPFSKRMLAVLNSLATRVDQDSHPLLAIRGDSHIEVVVVTGDRGLCGAFNTNIIKASAEFLQQREAEAKQTQLTLVGRKGSDYYKRRRRYKIRAEWVNIMHEVTYDTAAKVAEKIVAGFTTSETDAVYLVYNEFKSILQQRIVVEPLLPIRRLEETLEGVHLNYIYEQPPQEVFDDLLPRHVVTQVFHAMLESGAAEQAARMTAMEAATGNAGEMIEQLTLTMNRIRQASITSEIIEIVSGANALS